MTTRKKFSQIFSKKVESKKSDPLEIPRNKENDEHGEYSGTQNFFRSKSGRMKESTKIRMSLSPETYVPPDNIPQSAPVISTRKSGIGLTSRDLTKLESLRVTQSLQFLTLSKDSSPRSSKADNTESTHEFMDKDEVF